MNVSHQRKRSMVSTLLALMDGVVSRGEVVVIGATNRLDIMDPALRRPGRFDRELLFRLPDREARKAILKIHTRQWEPSPSEAFLEELAEICVGYSGADLKAVCVEAALCALRRRYPQIYTTSNKLLLDVNSISISSWDFVFAMEKMIPASQRAVSTPAKPLNPVLEPLLKASFNKTLTLLQRVFPQSAQGLRGTRDSDPVGSLYIELMHGDDAKPSNSIGAIHKKSNPQGFLKTSRYRNAMRQPTCCRPRLLLSGRPGSGHCAHLAQSVLHALEKLTVHTLDLPRLLGVGRALPEEACAQVFSEAKKTSPSILYLPNIQKWWDTVSATLKSTFLSLLQDIPSFSPILLLVTSDFPHEDLDEELQNLFCVEYGEVFSVPEPSQVERMKFFEDLILHQAATAPLSQRKSLLQSKEVLPLAPPSPPRQLSESEVLRLEEREEHTLRELRLVLRRVTERLALDRRFKAFCKPVDTEEVTALPMPDYCTVIKQPMDLSTLLTNIDMHKYITVNEFLNDVDLIWKNALEYKPDCDHTDRQIRHQACALKDTVRSIIKQELDKDLEKICEKIRESRNTRGFTSSRLAPWFCEVKEEGHRTEKLKQSQAFLSTRSTRKRKCVQQRPRKAKIRAQEQPLPKETPALIVDHEKLRGLLQHVVQRTESWEVIKLEKLYAYLAQCIYKHHQDYDKTSLIQEMRKEIDSFQ